MPTITVQCAHAFLRPYKIIQPWLLQTRTLTHPPKSHYRLFVAPEWPSYIIRTEKCAKAVMKKGAHVGGIWQTVYVAPSLNKVTNKINFEKEKYEKQINQLEALNTCFEKRYFLLMWNFFICYLVGWWHCIHHLLNVFHMRTFVHYCLFFCMYIRGSFGSNKQLVASAECCVCYSGGRASQGCANYLTIWRITN